MKKKYKILITWLTISTVAAYIAWMFILYFLEWFKGIVNN
jgi:hypothetical protein